ncbi:unnamed protein product [Bursaphelenchus xylophilus]|uniref:(pine wood nematode) hypothetical protein n=1 Tax=Bursaphelenchus xylophilus TaxID=6326 RepID=A0A1I7SCW6_BURXY|nr:unnamed protein product [Bursaphelenchus xylophilus]CAG9093348.1 unnamed protein product [Bursaphelenchus xylophilus]
MLKAVEILLIFGLLALCCDSVQSAAPYYGYDFNRRNNWASPTSVFNPFPFGPLNSPAPSWAFLYSNNVNDVYKH